MANRKEKIFAGLFHASVFKRLFLHLFFIAVYSSAVAFFHPHITIGKSLIEANSAMFIGVLLSMLLVFRTNSAYDRWWEARRAWGQLVNDMRNLCLKFDRLVKATPEERAEFESLISRFALSLKDHLRSMSQQPKHTDVPLPLTEANTPVAIGQEIYARLCMYHREGEIDSEVLAMLDLHARALMDVLGTCERISSSPITLAHKSILLQIIGVYIICLPWALAPAMGYFSVPLVVMGAYMVLGLELIAEEKEHPFGEGEEDLPLERFCDTIDRSAKEILHIAHIKQPGRDTDAQEKGEASR